MALPLSEGEGGAFIHRLLDESPGTSLFAEVQTLVGSLRE